MIVVDTGSTDNTKQIAIDHGAKVFDFEWINDFAAARIFSKAQTQCDYVIALDADERFNGLQMDLCFREQLNAQDSMACFIQLSEAESINDTIEESIRSKKSGKGSFLPRILKIAKGMTGLDVFMKVPCRLWERHLSS